MRLLSFPGAPSFVPGNPEEVGTVRSIMKSIRAAALALVLLFDVAACADTAPTHRAPGPPQTLLTYQRSGGLAGLTQRLEVLSDGTVTFENAGGRTSRFEISDERTKELTDTLEGIDWARAADEPAPMHADYFKDRKRGSDASWRIVIAGHEAIIFRYKTLTSMGTPTFYALWLDGEHFIELRSDVIPTVDEFRAVAAALHVVDVDTWLLAMPAGVVKPDERGDAVGKILADIPVPTNMNVDELKKVQTVSNGQSLPYEVTTAVVCGWVKQWMDATKTGDEATRQEAVEAMAGARRWEAFRERGQYETYVFEVADAMATDSPINSYRSLPTGVGYQRHLGCAED